MIRLQVSAYNRLLNGFNSSGPNDPNTTIFALETSKLGLWFLIWYANKRRFTRYIADAETGELYFCVVQSVASITDKTNPSALDPTMLHKLNTHAREISLRKLLTIVKSSPIIATH